MINDRDDEMLYEHEVPASQGRGCFFWGCLVTAILFLVLLVGIPVALYFTAKHYVNKYTSDTAAEIAVVELPEEELEALKARFDTFNNALEAGEQPEDLELTAEEINALINENPDFKERAFVRIQDGQVGGDISIPTDQFPGGGGRFFNASADFDVSMEGGVLIVTLADATVNGTPLPQPFLDTMEQENLAKDLYDDAETAEVLRKFESVEIKENRILLKAKPVAEEPTADTEADTETDSEAAPEPVTEVEAGDEESVEQETEQPVTD